ncbi:hypothetical protein PV797_03340 [Clostridiaceae bacterium M8S5]|nr:hypothetical protein PV797_03340 [Clostridiaceae bacterium M8S5]
MKNIDYKIVDYIKNSRSTKELTLTEKDDFLLLTIARSFPTPGYKMLVHNILEYKNSEYIINIEITSPPKNKVFTQVINFHELILQINKKSIKENYQFEIRYL